MLGEKNNPSHGQQLPIPILQWHQLAQQLSRRLTHTIAPKCDHLAAIDNVSDEGFALEMIGNSMLPLFAERTILIFDPRKTPYDGAYVLVFLNELNTYLFRELVVAEPDRFIKTTNPVLTEKLNKLTGKDKIIAT